MVKSQIFFYVLFHEKFGLTVEKLGGEKSTDFNGNGLSKFKIQYSVTKWAFGLVV